VSGRGQAFAALLALVGLLQGCGYSLAGRGANVDPSIRRMGVPLFGDATGKPGLDQKVTQKVIEELLKRGRFDVVQSASGVDAVVEGELVSYTVTPVGFSEAAGDAGAQPTTQASRYAITLVARVRYSRTGQQEPIWANDSFSFRDEYDVGEAETFFDREGQTLDRLAQAFARNLVAAMLEAF
jgi:hypothetical protein